MTKQLVSFGNFLFRKYGVKMYSTDGANTPLYDRLVDDADIANWEHENPGLIRGLPSGHQVGDYIGVSFINPGVDSCRVIKVHFTDSKVLYDIEVFGRYDTRMDSVGYPEDPNRWSTRIYNVDSVFVTKPHSL